MTKSSTTERDVVGEASKIAWKMDGENTVLCADGSVTPIPLTRRIPGAVTTSPPPGNPREYALPHGGESLVENLTAVHSIEYEPLNSLTRASLLLTTKDGA